MIIYNNVSIFGKFPWFSLFKLYICKIYLNYIFNENSTAGVLLLLFFIVFRERRRHELEEKLFAYLRSEERL